MMKSTKGWMPILFLVILGACAKKDDPAPYSQPQRFPYFGSATSFAALGANGISNDGTSTIYGDIGVSPGSSITGASTITRTGGEDHANDGLAVQAQADAFNSYNMLAKQHCDQDLSGQDLGGVALKPGTYCFSGNASLTGALILDAQGNPNANFVFQVSGNFVAAQGSSTILLDNLETCDVIWQVGGSVTLDEGSNITGGFVCEGSVIMNPGSKLNGKFLSHMGAIELHSSEIYNNFCPL